jgi:hypothetical protein
MALLFFALGTLLVLGLRWWWSWEPVWHTEVILAVAAMTAAPIGFLAGIGSFDYWLHYWFHGGGARHHGRDRPGDAPTQDDGASVAYLSPLRTHAHLRRHDDIELRIRGRTRIPGVRH